MTINNSISKYDWQYILSASLLISVFILTDLIGVIDKEYFYFVPKLISDQPYRIFTSILVHADLNHLLSNIGGIIITRYFLMRLGIESRFFYLKFILICSFWIHITNVFSTPVINEVVALNRSTLYDEDAESSDWIEIFNPNKDSINLEGYYLTDDQSDLKKWRFPNSLLASGEYVIVFASGKDRDEGELHANFKISKTGGYLGLVDPDGETVISEISDLPPQFEDFSYGIKSNSTSFSKVLVREGDACKILVPTRELAEQVFNVSIQITKKSNLKSCFHEN